MKKYLGTLLLAVFAVCALSFFFYDGDIGHGAGTFSESKADVSSMEKIKSAPRAIASAVKYATGNFKPDAKIDKDIAGDLRVEVLDEKTLCVVGNFEKFLKSSFAEECGGFLRGVDSPAANLPSWSRNMFYNILGAEIILKYRPVIAEAFNRGGDFEISDGARVSEYGYWLNPAGQAVFPKSDDGGDKLTRNAFVNHYAFLKLSEPLKSGVEYSVKTPLGQTVKFEYDAEKNVSGAIKTNQLGYSPHAGRKYAYVGSWLGSLGALDLSRLNGAEYFIEDERDGSRVYSGKLNRRGAESFYKTGASFTGEDVFEADFSDFGKEGEYRICVPSVGRSLPFKISNDAVGEAFYIHSKGLYHKRCGIAKEQPYTNWTMGECHMHTYESDFPPNNNHYKPDKKRDDCGFYNENGEQVEVSHFKLIEARKTDRVLDLHGGWHDAADYDRRPYHYDVVCDLLSAYLFKPENFTDAQLNIPESSNGVPDIIDEAAWGMELWRNAQKDDGSVPGWIEATSHPVNYNPSTDEQPYYLSAATMESTMQYAALASMLALAYENAGFENEANLYKESALRAYRWASDSSNRFVKEYDYPAEKKIDGKKTVEIQRLTYKEAAQVPSEYVFKAAFNLWKLTGQKEFLDACKSVEKDMSQKFAETSWRINPLMFGEFLKYGADVEPLSKVYETYKARMLKYADERFEWLNENYPYRIPWYPSDHPYVTHMSWGKFHPLNLAKFFMNAYELTGDKKYRDAAHLCNDWHCGANPTGQSMTSGLGKNYPVRFLDLPSYSDGIAEYVQGITPYRNTFGIARDDIAMAHALIYEPRKDRGFEPKPTMLLPRSIVGDGGSLEEVSRKVGAAWPIWRRFANVEAYSVAASEYTVSETIAPAAALTGWLLEPGFKPSEELKNRKPAEDISVLGGFAPLP